VDDLDRELRALSAWLETPDAPEVTARVRARLAAHQRRRWWQRWRAYLAAMLVVALLAVLPPGRAAVADAVTGLLRFAGVTVTVAPGSVPPTGTPSPLPSQRLATTVEAQRLVRFPVQVPAALGPPEQMLVADPDDDGSYRVLTLLYRGGTVRVDAFDGALDPYFTKKISGSAVEWTQVRGDFAVWVGGPHTLTYVDRTGKVREETARLAGSTLIWERAGVSYRLEGDLTRPEAIRIAESLG
jgi:hypothetical protein